MIIVDYGILSTANISVWARQNPGQPVNIDMIRHMILNSLRGLNSRFSKEYGQLVLACDANSNWRRKEFPYYKIHRAKIKEESVLDWKTINIYFEQIREEMALYLPYPILHVDNAEADDIIATLVMDRGVDNRNKMAWEETTGEPLLVVSKDHDFKQLHKFSNVKQYDSSAQKMIDVSNPERYLFEHIVRGDRGDGIPNILSPDNCLAIGQRQKSVFDKKLDEWYGQDWQQFCTEDMYKNVLRNEQLICFDKIPNEIRENVRVAYTAQSGKTRKHLMNYFVKFRLRNLLENLQDF